MEYVELDDIKCLYEYLVKYVRCDKTGIMVICTETNHVTIHQKIQKMLSSCEYPHKGTYTGTFHTIDFNNGSWIKYYIQGNENDEKYIDELKKLEFPLIIISNDSNVKTPAYFSVLKQLKATQECEPMVLAINGEKKNKPRRTGKIKVIDPKTGQETVYENAVKAAEAIGAQKHSVSRARDNPKTLLHGYRIVSVRD